MGGWMTYQRARARARLRRKPPDDPDPYFHDAVAADLTLSEGDFNRMERDYLDPVYPQPPYASRPAGSDPLSQTATATGVDVEDVRKVLRYVFMEQP